MDTLEYFLFPHTVLSEADCGHLALLVPHLHLLQVARQLDLPEWEQQFFSARHTISDEQGHQVRALLQEYKSFADSVGNGAVLASLRHLSDEKNRPESRFRIQSTIKGQGKQRQLHTSEEVTLEAALFLEMARDLDQQGMELEGDVVRARNLEREFRNILGIAGEDDLEEPLEIGDVPLAPEKSYMTFMLGKRMAFWLRLFSAARSENFPVLVTVAPEVVEELLDPLMSVADAVIKPASEIVRIPLASIPSLKRLNNEQLRVLVDELKAAGILQAYGQSLENVLRNPKESFSIEELGQHAAQLRSRLADHCRGDEYIEREQIDLSLTLIENLTIEDLWKKLDKDGAQSLKSGKAMQHRVVVLLAQRNPAIEATE